MIATRFAQEDAFVQHCIKSMDGEPLPSTFAQDYPTAVAELLEKATDLANAIEERVSDSVKKSPALSTGKGSGQVKKASIESLSSAAG